MESFLPRLLTHLRRPAPETMYPSFGTYVSCKHTQNLPIILFILFIFETESLPKRYLRTLQCSEAVGKDPPTKRNMSTSKDRGKSLPLLKAYPPASILSRTLFSQNSVKNYARDLWKFPQFLYNLMTRNSKSISLEML